MPTYLMLTNLTAEGVRTLKNNPGSATLTGTTRGVMAGGIWLANRLRDTHPEIWYPTVGGTPKAQPDPDFPTFGLVKTQYVGGVVQKFDDLPAKYRANIDQQMPLDGRPAGSRPPLTDAQVADLICFLKTLTDGYQPSAQPTSGACTQ